MTNTNDTLEVGDVWVISLSVADGAEVAVTVTNPSGDTSSPTPVVAEGEVTISVPLLEGGRYLAVVLVTTEGVPDVTPFTVLAEVPGGHVPTVEEVTAYLSGGGEISEEPADIQDAYDAELDDQFKVCNIPATYTYGLGQALKRRVARNLAARKVPIAQITSFDNGVMTSRVPRNDTEVVRFEGKYRKVNVG